MDKRKGDDLPGQERGGKKGTLAVGGGTGKMKHHTCVIDLPGLIKSHREIKKTAENKFNTETAPSDDFKARPLCRIKEPASTSGWRKFTLEAAETKFVEDFPLVY